MGCFTCCFVKDCGRSLLLFGAGCNWVGFAVCYCVVSVAFCLLFVAGLLFVGLLFCGCFVYLLCYDLVYSVDCLFVGLLLQ